MTPPSTSASPHKPPTPEEKSTRAKLDFIRAAHAASPLRMVEKHPVASVTATAAATMAITVIATSRLFTSAGVNVLSRGLGLAGMLAKSNVASAALQSVIAKATGAVPPPGGSPFAAGPSPTSPVNAVG